MGVYAARPAGLRGPKTDARALSKQLENVPKFYHKDLGNVASNAPSDRYTFTVPQRIDALIRPRWTLAVEPRVAVSEGLTLAIDAGRILAVLPDAEARKRFAPAALHERPAHVLMPGLVNAHCHAGMSLLRGLADDLPLAAWLGERIWPAERRLVTQEFVADGTRLAAAEMLLGGITCFSDMYYFPDIVAGVASEMGVRAVVGMIALESPTPWAATVDEYIAKGLEVHDRYRQDKLITTTFASHTPYSLTDATLKRIRQLADELDVPIHVHLHETEQEIQESLATTGQRPLARLESLGLLTSALIGVHATQLADEEIDKLAAAKAHIVHCPRANLKLASGACPVAKLQKAGVNVALGTDGAASNNRLDIWSELELAALFGKHVAGDATAVSAPSVLRMATINGARALGLEAETGSLAPGKAADVICVELAGPTQSPVLDPISQLAYSASREQVTDVWVAGEHLVVDRALTRIDVAALDATARSWAERVARP
jgi:5-methylthioadenosine/S-adenosylhomocysteine deaminase